MQENHDYTIIDYLQEYCPDIFTDPDFPDDPEAVRDWLDEKYYERELSAHIQAGEDVFPDPHQATRDALDSIERAIRANRAVINSYRE